MAARSDSTYRGKTSDFADRMVGVACALAILVTTLLLSVLCQKGGLPSSCDFASYWATGQQLVHHANPYDPGRMGELERTAGFMGHGSCYMRNPPWALPLVLPLGWLSPRAAVLPWSLLMLAVLILSVRLLRPVLGLSGFQLQLLGYCFPPALHCVVVGQTSLFLLLGLVLFLRLHRTRPFWAGAALGLCMLKPHLFLPFGMVLLAWIVVSRGYRILAGGAVTLAAGSLLALWLDPAAFSQYLQWAHSSGISTQPVPCFGVMLRKLIDPGAQWLVFIPAAIACCWALAYFWPRRHTWDWIENGSLLTLVSLVAAPYSFLFDQGVAIPALLFAASRSTSRAMLAALATLYMLVVIHPWIHWGPIAFFYSWLWQAPAWLVWFGIARARERSARQEHPAPVAAYAPTAG